MPEKGVIPRDTQGNEISLYRTIKQKMQKEYQQQMDQFKTELDKYKNKNQLLAQQVRTLSSRNQALNQKIKTLNHQLNAQNTNDKKKDNKTQEIKALNQQIKNLKIDLNVKNGQLISYLVPGNLIKQLKSWVKKQHESTKIDIRHKYVAILTL